MSTWALLVYSLVPRDLLSFLPFFLLIHPYDLSHSPSSIPTPFPVLSLQVCAYPLSPNTSALTTHSYFLVSSTSRGVGDLGAKMQVLMVGTGPRRHPHLSLVGLLFLVKFSLFSAVFVCLLDLPPRIILT